MGHGFNFFGGIGPAGGIIVVELKRFATRAAAVALVMMRLAVAYQVVAATIAAVKRNGYHKISFFRGTSDTYKKFHLNIKGTTRKQAGSPLGGAGSLGNKKAGSKPVDLLPASE
jgi:hypothetical protein